MCFFNKPKGCFMTPLKLSPRFDENSSGEGDSLEEMKQALALFKEKQTYICFSLNKVLFLTPLKLRRRFNQSINAYTATADQLSLIINPIEGSTELKVDVHVPPFNDKKDRFLLFVRDYIELACYNDPNLPTMQYGSCSDLVLAMIVVKLVAEPNMVYHSDYKMPWHFAPFTAGFQASIHPVLNFVVYVVPQTHYPLYIYDDQGNQLETNSFLSPKWGGVLFYNVAKFPGPGDVLPQPVEIDMRSVFQVFLAQLSLLVGLPDKSYDRAVHYLESPVPSHLDVAFLLRRRTQDYLSTSSSSLKSLSELLSKISNIVVKDEIGELIYSSVSYAKKSFDLLNKGDLENAFRNAEAAFLASEKAFFDPSLLALLYFPDDQKYAIYIPLFLPISLPVVMSIRGLWTYYRNRKISKAEKQD